MSPTACSLPPSAANRNRSGRTGWIILAVVVAIAIVAFWLLRGGDEKTGHRPKADPKDQLARELAAAWFSKVRSSSGALQSALAALKPLLDRKRPALEDVISAAILENELASPSAPDAAVHAEAAQQWLTRALQIDPDSPHAHYILGRISMVKGDFAAALPHLRAALKGAPDDLPTMLSLGIALEETDAREAERFYRAILAKGLDQAGSWYKAAVYRMALLSRDQDRTDEMRKFFDEHDQLVARGITSPDEDDQRRGTLGRLKAPEPSGKNVVPLAPLGAFGAPTTIVPELAGAARLLAADLDGDGGTDVVAWGPKGLAVALRNAAGEWSGRALVRETVDRAIAIDLWRPPVRKSGEPPPEPPPEIDNTSRLDLIYFSGGALRWLEVRGAANAGVEWAPREAPIVELGGTASDLLALDYDHDGDLDLCCIGSFGTHLLRNDGAGSPQPKGRFTDVTAEAGLAPARGFDWCVTEDFDVDQDVDLLLGSAEDLFLASNLRGGRFADASDVLDHVGATAVAPIVADLDGDARPDLWTTGPATLLHLNQLSGAFKEVSTPKIVPAEGGALAKLAAAAKSAWIGPVPGSISACDLDADGAVDAVWRFASGANEVISVQRAIGLAQQKGDEIELAGAGTSEPLLADLDGDLAIDIARSTEHGLEILKGPKPTGHVFPLTLRGKKDNRRGIGAVVELRAGETYQRVYWRGETELIGLGAASELEWLRITWPNGVIQYELERSIAPRTIEQAEGLVGSCPFLYTWDGTRNRFITDVLGITPLGLQMAPGMFVAPDHDEFVLVRGEELAPKDGVYELSITEELREVTYLDRALLQVVDHPADTEIYPNELFCFPPFPIAHTHTVRGALSPTRVTGSDGKDWTKALAKIDDDYAAPFELAPPQMLGLATPHSLEIEFDRTAIAKAKTLRLLLTGWFYWTDASVNMASARDPDYQFMPPMLAVPDGSGGWKGTGPPIGFPAGKTKTMVVDVSEILLRTDPRLRLTSTLRLYWDSIRLAIDDDDAELVTTPIEPTSAKLWRRGFSDPLHDTRPNQPARFEWERLAHFPRWNPHPGMYTRYGETQPLLGEVDDRFVIMATGDALTLTFDASKAPPLPAGWRRDFLLFLDGWAKDRDPNTVEAEFVEPLPFHGMSGYPYGAKEHFPDDDEHRAWSKEWNTRPAEPWIPRGPDVHF